MDKPIIHFDTERLHVRSVEESDKEAYMDLRVETSEIAQAYQTLPGFRDREWNGELNSQKDIFLSVFLKKNDVLIASASFQNYESDCIELGFDVTERYRKQGIATELVQGMLEIVSTLFPGKTVSIKTNVTNSACRRVAEKCGGVFSGYEPNRAAMAMETLLESFGNKPTDNKELQAMRMASAEYIKENKETVCVYIFGADY